MAGIKGINTRVLVGGYLLSSQTNSATVQASNNSIETTPFEATAKEYVVLPPDGNIDIGGYLTFDTANGATFEKRLHTSLTTADTVGLIYYNTAVAGAPGYVLPSAYTDNLQIQSPVAGVITVSGSYTSTTGLRRGVCIYSGTISATGTTTAVDIGAAGSAGGYAYLFVTTETGSGTNAAIDIESATSAGGTYSSEGTFTFSAIGAVAVTMSGTVNRYLRLNTTSLGGATSWAVTCIACVSGVTY